MMLNGRSKHVELLRSKIVESLAMVDGLALAVSIMDVIVIYAHHFPLEHVQLQRSRVWKLEDLPIPLQSSLSSCLFRL
jgi:hypothetical protein